MEELGQDSDIKQMFEEIRQGGDWRALQSLIQPEQYAAHEAHVKRIFNPINRAAESFSHDEGVYNPEVSSSTFMMIRALLSFYEPVPFQERVLEIGAGSGGVSLYIQQQNFGRFFTLTDISEASILSAKKNIANLKLEKETEVIQSDLFQNVTGKYNTIIFNAPLWHKRDARTEELSLVDPNGALMERFLQEAEPFLTEDGMIFLAFSNLCLPDLLKKHRSRYDFRLILAEYIGYTGMLKSVYKLTRKNADKTLT